MEEIIIYDKPFKTYDEMINLLENRNVIITDKDFAKECLSDISYYTLINGFKNLYEIDEDDKFVISIKAAKSTTSNCHPACLRQLGVGEFAKIIF